MPDVRLFPFHTTGTALPELEPGSWRDLISGSAGSSSGAVADGPRERTAGILLSEPHFTAVGCNTTSCLENYMRRKEQNYRDMSVFTLSWLLEAEAESMAGLSLDAAGCAEVKTL